MRIPPFVVAVAVAFAVSLIETSPAVSSCFIRITAAGPIVVEGGPNCALEAAKISTNPPHYTEYTFTEDIYIDYGGISVERDNITIDGDGYTLHGPGTTVGFYIEPTSGVTVKNVNIDDFQDGVLLQSHGDNNTVTNCTITNCAVAFQLYEADNNVIFGNTMKDNGAGVSLGAPCSGNKFYHNNFINSSSAQVYPHVTSSTWDDGAASGGNYWDDHSCTGDPSSGQPYTINGSNVDSYPFEHENGWECKTCPIHEAQTGGGTQSGVLVRSSFEIVQNEFMPPDTATDVHFILWQKESNVHVNGWNVCVSDFAVASSERTDQPGSGGGDDSHAVRVDAWDGKVAYDDTITIDVCFWLTGKNTVRIDSTEWTDDGDKRRAVPSFGWTIDDPELVMGDQWGHNLAVHNDDPTRTLRLESCVLKAEDAFVENLESVSFDVAVPGLPAVLNPADSITYRLTTDKRYAGGHIYGRIVLRDATGDDYEVIAYIDHSVVAPDQGTGTGVTEPPPPPAFGLHQNVPNPFNPTTTVTYDVPANGVVVTIKIFDVAGRLVKTLLNERQRAGTRTVVWDGKDGHGTIVATGVYFCRMLAPGFTQTRKMVFLK